MRREHVPISQSLHQDGRRHRYQFLLEEPPRIAPEPIALAKADLDISVRSLVIGQVAGWSQTPACTCGSL